MNKYLFIGLLAALAIIVIYFLTYWHANGEFPGAPFSNSVTDMRESIGRTYDDYFSTAETMYEKTIGHINDEAAEMAIRKAEKKERMHAKNEENGRLSNKNAPDAANNAFILADMMRFNVAPNSDNADETLEAERRAATLYNHAVTRLAQNPLGVIEEERDNPHRVPAELIIMRAEDFYDDMIARETHDPDALNRINLENLNQAREAVRNANIQAAENRVQRQITPKRRKRPKKKGVKATVKQQAQDQYFEERDVRNDPQNVHEHQVNNDMVRIYRRILARNGVQDDILGHGAPQPSINEIKNYAKTHKFDDKQRRRAQQTISKMAEGNWISNLKARENEILLNVWKRANSPDNEGRHDELKNAVMDSLADCVEDGYNGTDYQVCASGRTARVLSSLVLLDQDDSIAAPVKTAEILRNEVFSKAHQIIQNALKDTDTETAQAYNGVLESPAPDVAQKVDTFETNVKKRISDELKQDYADTVDAKTLNNLISDAQAGV